jgi:hypothetical protein
MDPSDNDVEVDEALMAQMGFSSFGAASPPSKRRRYNPNADASLPSKSSATGANSTALGTGSNTDEIALDDDDDGDDDEKESKSGQQASDQVRPASLPQRPAPASVPRQGQHSAQRERSDTWYIGYYDHLSNANPWERIEKARGLTTRGTWVIRENANATTTADAPA